MTLREKIRDAVRRKLGAYHRHIQIGLIAQGTLQYLAVSCPRLVWASFGSWLRTVSVNCTSGQPAFGLGRDPAPVSSTQGPALPCN
jgi:hypothetical protein